MVTEGLVAELPLVSLAVAERVWGPEVTPVVFHATE